MNCIRDLETERGISAFVGADNDAVDDDFAEVIDRAKLEQYVARVTELRQFKVQSIPRRAHIVAQIIKLHVPRKTDARAAPGLHILSGRFAQHPPRGIDEDCPSIPELNARGA